MFTVLNNTRNSNLYLIIALAIMVFVILGFTIAPSIAAPKPAAVIIPVTGSEGAYLEYLRGEKALYANPVALNNALADYHLGEKLIYADNANSNDALTAYHLGEKQIVNTLESAMWAYRMGEKDLK